MIRDADIGDFHELLPLAIDAHRKSFLAEYDVDVNKMRRVFALCVTSDLGFAKVCERAGRIRSVLTGFITPNQVGIPVASDYLIAGNGGTDGLVREFIKWAEAGAAAAVVFTNMSGNERLSRMLEAFGAGKIAVIHGRAF